MTRETDTIQRVLIMCDYVVFHSLSKRRDQEIVFAPNLLLCSVICLWPRRTEMLPEPVLWNYVESTELCRLMKTPHCFISSDDTLNRATSSNNAYLPLHDCEDTRSSNF